MKKRKIPDQFPQLETERLLLRQLALSDAPGLFRNYADPEVVQYMMAPLSRIEDAEKMIGEVNDLFEKGRGIFWAVLLKPDQAFIGTCSFEAVRIAGIGEIGFDLGRPWWGKGLMREALTAVITFGYEVLDLKEIVAITSVDNKRAVKLLHRLGFQVRDEKEGNYRMSIKRMSWLRSQTIRRQ